MSRENTRLIETRRTAFGALHDLDPDLLEWCRDVDSHDVIINPTLQNTYLYLTHYVVDIAEQWFGRPVSELNVLDWGAGKGQVSHLLAKRGARPISCDLLTDSDDSTYGQAVPIIEHAGIEVIALDGPVELPFESATMDVVVSFGVLEHVADDVGSLHEINRVLATGGLFLCFNLPYRLSWTQRVAHLQGDRYHDRLYGRRQVRQMLTESGFDVLDMWHRQLLPKNATHYPRYRDVERIDQWMTEHTPLRRLATSLEFAAAKA